MSVRAPDTATDTALGSARRHLELDLEKVERVHAEHGDRSRADSGERVVLKEEKYQERKPAGERDHKCMLYDTHNCMGREETWL